MTYERIMHIRQPGAQYCLCGRRSLNSTLAGDKAATCKRCLHVLNHDEHMGSKRYPVGVPSAFLDAVDKQRVTKSELVELLWYVMLARVLGRTPTDLYAKDSYYARVAGEELVKILKANREVK